MLTNLVFNELIRDKSCNMVEERETLSIDFQYNLCVYITRYASACKEYTVNKYIYNYMPNMLVSAYLVTMLTQLKTIALSQLRRNRMPTDI